MRDDGHDLATGAGDERSQGGPRPGPAPDAGEPGPARRDRAEPRHARPDREQPPPARAGLAGTDPGHGDDGSWLHGTWVVTEVDGTRPSPGAQGLPWLVLEGDGVVYGYAGVNRVRGTWSLEDGALRFGPVVATRMAGPEAATATERRVLAFLGAGGAVEPGAGGILVRGRDGPSVELERTTTAPDDRG